MKHSCPVVEGRCESVCVEQRPVWCQGYPCPWRAALSGLQGLPIDPCPGSEVEGNSQPELSLPEETNLVKFARVCGSLHSGWLLFVIVLEGGCEEVCV